jgi:hypothetical protein
MVLRFRPLILMGAIDTPRNKNRPLGKVYRAGDGIVCGGSF